MIQRVCGPHFEKYCFKSCKCLGKFDNLLTILISKTTSFSSCISVNHSFFTLYVLIWGIENGLHNSILGQKIENFRINSEFKIDYVLAVFSFTISTILKTIYFLLTFRPIPKYENT